MPVIEDDDRLREILSRARTIAVVGLSANPWRDSHSVSAYMLSRGYSIIPVNPHIESVFGIKAVPSLSAISTSVDIVNVFRRPEHVPGIVDEALARGVPTLWLQTGIIHPEATSRASNAGMNVIVDSCIRVVCSLLLR